MFAVITRWGSWQRARVISRALQESGGRLRDGGCCCPGRMLNRYLQPRHPPHCQPSPRLASSQPSRRPGQWDRVPKSWCHHFDSLQPPRHLGPPRIDRQTMLFLTQKGGGPAASTCTEIEPGPAEQGSQPSTPSQPWSLAAGHVSRRHGDAWMWPRWSQQAARLQHRQQQTFQCQA